MLKNNLKSLQHSNDPAYFQRLNLVFLKDHAKSVVTRFSEIPFDRIVLYRHRARIKAFQAKKYAVVFFIENTVDKQLYEEFKEASGISNFTGIILPTLYHDDMKYVRICVDQHFSEAYKDSPPKDYIEEWIFIPQLTSEAIYPGVEVEGHKWVLYDASEIHSLHDVIEADKPASQELASLRSSLQADGMAKPLTARDILLDENEKDFTARDLLTKGIDLTEPEKKTRPEAIKPFPCEAGRKDDVPSKQSSIGVASQVDDCKAVARGLKLSYEADGNIKIQLPNRTPKFFDHTVLGFNKKKPPWKTLCKILEGPEHTYCVGPAHTHPEHGKRERNESYDAKRGVLREISKRITGCVNKNWDGIRIPREYFLFEPDPSKGKGVYKPIFQAGDTNILSDKIESKLNRLTKDQLLDVIYSGKKGSIASVELAAAVKIAFAKKWLTGKEITSIIKPDSDGLVIQELFKDIRYAQYENKEDVEPDY